MVYEIETVIDCEKIEEIYDKDTETAINSKNVKFVGSRKDHSGVCFNYALSKIWGYIDCCELAYEILEFNYKQIGISKAKRGDIISYHDINDFKSKYERPCKENCFHFAIIDKTNGTLKDTIIKSKWGGDGVFRTNLYDVPDTYGNAIVIWRKIK